MAEQVSWRSLLGEVIADPQEKQRLCTVLQVRSLTLERWRDSKSDPRPHNIRQLLAALPDYRERMARLIEAEFTGVLAQAENGPQEISASFYAHVLRAVALTPQPRFWSIVSTITDRALAQLDPERLGIALTVTLCMPPHSDGKIYSLHATVAQGTPPWRADFSERRLFLGAESLAGHVCASGHRAVIHLVQEDRSLPFRGDNRTECAAAFPFFRASHIAGCLTVESAIPRYFSPERIELCEYYTDLISLALEPEDFYHPQSLMLRFMPPEETQQPLLDAFHQRVGERLHEAARKEETLSKVQVEALVWRQIERDLLAMSETNAPSSAL